MQHISKPVQSLAILKVNADRGADYIDCFVPFIIEAISRTDRALTSAEIQPKVIEDFAIEIPVAVLSTICDRAFRSNKLTRTADRRYRAAEGSDHSAETRANELVEQFNGIAAELANYVKSSNLAHWDEDEAAGRLLDFLARNAGSVLHARVNGRPILNYVSEKDDFDYIVGRYIAHTFQRTDGDDAIGVLESLLKGAMLTGALLYPEIDKVKQRFRNTSVLFDTPFVLQALGLEGQEPARPRLETISLAHALGAVTGVFQHTVDEIRGILNSAVVALRSRYGGRSFGRTVRRMIEDGWKAGDVEEVLAQLEVRLNQIGLVVVDAPPYNDRRYSIDHAELASLLDTGIQHYRPTARDVDIDSVAAIVRMRRGRFTRQIDMCHAVFVTTNAALVRISNDYIFASGMRSGSDTVPELLSADLFSTLCWLKNPIAAPKLPREQIIADALAVLDPTEALWREWAERVDQLEASSDVSADFADTLRYSMAARQALMDVSLGDPYKLRQPGSMNEVIRRVKADFTAELQSQMSLEEQRLRNEIDAVRSAVESLEKDKMRTREELAAATSTIEALRTAGEFADAARRETRSARASAWGSWCSVIILAIPAIVIVGLCAVGPILDPKKLEQWIPASLLGVAAVLLAVAGSVFDVSLRSVHVWLSGRLSGFWEKRLATWAGE